MSVKPSRRPVRFTSRGRSSTDSRGLSSAPRPGAQAVVTPIAAPSAASRHRGHRVSVPAPARLTNGGQAPTVVRCAIYTRKCTTRSLPAQEIEDFVVEQIRKLARDPDLIREVFEESIRQRQEQLTRLESEHKRLGKQRQQKGEEIRRLVSAISGTSNPSPSLSERLAEMERQLADVDRRLSEIDTHASSLRDQSIDLPGVTAALEEFEAVWGVMCCTERAGMVNSLVSTVTCGADMTLSIDLRTSLCYGTEKRAG